MSDLSDEVRRRGAELRNWGRWGDDDERGTLNHITPDRLKLAVDTVKRGVSFSLQLPLGKAGPPGSGPRGTAVHTMVAAGTDVTQPVTMAAGARYMDDAMFLYLQCGTHWDSLAHIYYDDALFNGFAPQSADSNGASRLGIEKAAGSFISRGILVDLPRYFGVDCLPHDQLVDGEVLDAVTESQGSSPSAGDIVLLRTGVMAEYARSGSWAAFGGPQAGLHHSAAEWLYDHEIAAVAGDNVAVEPVDRKTATVPLHMIALRDMGMCFGEMFYLEELADDSAADGVYESLLVAPPLRIDGAVGAPVHPVAIK